MNGDPTRGLYESMSVDELLRLRWAFQQDIASVSSTATVAITFAEDRLKLIAQVLAKRSVWERLKAWLRRIWIFRRMPV